MKRQVEWNGKQYNSIKEAAQDNGYTYNALWNLISNGYTCDADKMRQNLGKKWSEEDVLFIRNRHDEGWSVAKIAQYMTDKYNLSRGDGLDAEVRQILIGKTYKKYGGQIFTQDELISSDRITPDEIVIAIRKQLKAGVPVYELVDIYDISHYTIRQVARGGFEHLHDIEPPLVSIPRQRDPRKMAIAPDERQKIRDYYAQFDTTFKRGTAPDGYITYQMMADRYDVDISYISRIVSGER